MIRVKICGITNLEDAISAIALGADALGFIFVEGTPRSLDPEDAYDITHQLPPFVLRVGVFMNDFIGRVNSITRFCGLDAIQFHGDETPEYIRQFSNIRVVKTIHIKNEKSLGKMKDFDLNTFLLDTYDPDLPGGTGKRFNIELAEKAVKSSNRVILSGGLNEDNITSVLDKVQPYAVDVSSGVETSVPGKKDYTKMKNFIEKVKKF